MGAKIAAPTHAPNPAMYLIVGFMMFLLLLVRRMWLPQ
jgi:hypothetical protein